jgi:L-fuculose-phosphate aldolase
MNETVARRQLTDICTKLYDRNLTISAGGNMSMRLDDGTVIITPSGRNKGMLEPDDMVKIDMDGNVIGEGKPSMETGFHLMLYTKNPGTNAVVHCHPLYCTSLAVMGKKVRTSLTPEGIILLGDVPMIRYETPGSKELVDAVSEHSDAKAMVLARHGAITQGRDIVEAYNRMEELEFQARMQIIVGRTSNLSRAEVEKLGRM